MEKVFEIVTIGIEGNRGVIWIKDEETRIKLETENFEWTKNLMEELIKILKNKQEKSKIYLKLEIK